MMCQTRMADSVVAASTRALLMLFPAYHAVSAAHVTHLSWNFRLHIQSPRIRACCSHIALTDSFFKFKGKRKCTIGLLNSHSPKIHPADLSGLLTEDTMAHYRTLQSITVAADVCGGVCVHV